MSTPIAPRLDSVLDAWSGEAEGVVEIDRSLAEGVDFAGATRIAVDASRIEGATLTGLRLDKLEMTDVVCTKLESAALQAYKANLLRVRAMDSRFTGAEFAEGHFEDCVFRGVKFDEVGFRFSTFKRVRFENCMLRQADFSNAKLTQVTFTGCDLEAASFVSATCRDVDVTTEDLTAVKGILGFKGATISEVQLLQLAPLLAAELGFRVEGVERR